MTPLESLVDRHLIVTMRQGQSASVMAVRLASTTGSGWKTSAAGTIVQLAHEHLPFEVAMISSLSPWQTAFSPSVERGSGRSLGSEQRSGVQNGLSVDQQRQVEALRAIDRKVRAHELAHVAVGGGLVGAASFSYQVGPDKQRYAVAGEVSIDVSAGRDAEETIARAEQIRAAALAPADPSSQDRRVAALATRMEDAARQELASQGSAANATDRGRRVSGALAAYQAPFQAPRTNGFSVFA